MGCGTRLGGSCARAWSVYPHWFGATASQGHRAQRNRANRQHRYAADDPVRTTGRAGARSRSYDNPGKDTRKSLPINLIILIALAVHGGWPRAVGLDPGDGALIARQYIKSIVGGKDVEFEGVRYSPAKLEVLLRSLSRNTATMASMSTIRKDVSSVDANGLSRSTVLAYVDYLQRIYMIWEQPAWRAGIAFGNAPANHAQTPRYRPLPCGCKLEGGAE